jgi:hypothetical protein
MQQTMKIENFLQQIMRIENIAITTMQPKKKPVGRKKITHCNKKKSVG